MTRYGNGLRILGILAMAIALAHCGGGGGGGDGKDDSGSPPPGSFAGALSDDGFIRLEVGSIEEVEFDCDGVDIQETFDPPAPIDADRRFDVRFTDGGRRFRIQGEFLDDDTVEGTIDDQEDDCDVDFAATRGERRTPTPTATPSGGVTPTGDPNTPTATVTPTTSAFTDTPTPVCTADCSPIPSPSACPVAVEVLGNAGDAEVLDSGWTGFGHDATVVSDGKLTFTLSNCDSATRPCGACDVSGPIPNLDAGAGGIDAQRCGNDTSIPCTDNTPCGSGQCVFFFGSPLPLVAGGVSTCVTNELKEAVSGTADIETGAFASTITLTSRVSFGIALDQPCPVCTDTTLNDSVKGGSCVGGPKSGQTCDANGTSPLFGTTSFDCPPAAAFSALTIPLAGSSGTETRTLGASSPNCGDAGVQDKKCFCPGAGSVLTRPNACLDDTTTPQEVEACALIGGTNEGECAGGPFDRYCLPSEPFRGCTSNAECPVGGDSCQAIRRPCYADNGEIGGSVTAIGEPDPPSNGIANPTFATLFCIPPVAQPSVNAAAGLPGLGRLELPLRTKEILTLP